MELKQPKTAYYLLQKDRVYKDRTLSSLYFKSAIRKVKNSCPIDIDGIRYKLDLHTGEIRNYKRSEVQNSFKMSLKRTQILMNMLLDMNEFDWFCTLTFDNDKIDRTNASAVFKAYVKYINNIKKQFPNLGYMTFPEQHEDHCFHFHLLINGVTPQQLGFENSGKVCCSWAYKKNKIASKAFFEKTKNDHELTDTDGLTVYNITTFTYGYTTATRIVSRERCNSYVKKYVEKALGSTDIFKKRFYYSSNLKVPSIVEKLIGADFNKPAALNELQFIQDDPHIKNAEYINFNQKHNVLQYWENNSIKEMLDIVHAVKELPFCSAEQIKLNM